MNAQTKDRDLRDEWTVPCDASGWVAVIRNVAPYFLLLALAPLLARKSSVAPWLLAPLLGLFAYRITIVMHDCTHRTLFASAPLNTHVGRFLGAVTGIDFESFKTQHWLHHRIYGQPGDPQGFHYAGLSAMSAAKFHWHLIRPLLGLNLAHVFGESMLHPRNLRRLLGTGEIVAVGAVQTVILVIVTGAGNHPALILLPVVSTVTFGLWYSQLRGIAEHGVIGRKAEAGVVRSHAPYWLDQILLYDLNFNYHTEHHLYPSIPSCYLPAMHRALQPTDAKFGASMSDTIGLIYANIRSAHGKG